MNPGAPDPDEWESLGRFFLDLILLVVVLALISDVASTISW
jgi:hypothetical protein